MKLISVIPISKTPGHDTLTYFTSADVEVGALVEAPLRSKMVKAIVVSSSEAVESKAEIKSLPYQIKKIKKLSSSPIFLPEFIETAKEISNYYIGNLGSVLYSMSPKGIFESIKSPSSISTASKDPSAPRKIGTNDKKVIQADEKERYANYKSLIREHFAKKSSVLICLPSTQDVRHTKKMLEKGIEKYTHLLHSTLPKKELLNTWNKAVEEKHSVLIICTGSFMGIPRTDIGTIIIEKENSRNYKMQTRPYVDIRMFAEIYAKKTGTKLLQGDTVLRIETLWRAEKGEFTDFIPLKWRSLAKSRQEVIDMKKYRISETGSFTAISDELKNLIEETKKNNENLFIFNARRGLAPSTVCADCGTIVLCSRCSAPIILHTGSVGNFFLCHRCGEKRTAEERCKTCDGWRLVSLGVGLELVIKTIHESFPDIKLFRIDKDSTKTDKSAEKVAENFYSSPGSVLIGTEMALPYLRKEIANCAISSIDSLFSIPDFRINEKIFQILLSIRALATKNFIIQTRDTSHSIIEFAIKGNLIDYYREEIEARKNFNYPPVSTIIKLTTEGTRESAQTEMDAVKNLIAPVELSVFPAFIETVRNKFRLNAIIKIEKKDWPRKDLFQKLSSFPPSLFINVDPESLL